MFKFLQRLTHGVKPAPDVKPAEVLARLETITSDAVIEDVWEAMDHCSEEIFSDVAELVRRRASGVYPYNTALIWWAYTLGNNGDTIKKELLDSLAAAITWAFRFEENNVLIGGALGALDAVPSSHRQEVATDVFDALGDASSRRYWLLLKVRDDKFVGRVVEALDRFARKLPPMASDAADPEDPAFIALLEALEPRRRMAGAFRQFGPQDATVLLKHFRLENAGAEFLIEALASTRSPQVIPALRSATVDQRPAVRRSAEGALERLGA